MPKCFRHYFIHETHRLFFILPLLLKEHSSFSDFMFSFSLPSSYCQLYLFFSYGSLLTLLYFFWQNVRNWSFRRTRRCSSTVLDLPLFIYSNSLSYHGSHVINHTSSHHNFSVAPSLTPLLSPPICRMLLWQIHAPYSLSSTPVLVERWSRSSVFYIRLLPEFILGTLHSLLHPDIIERREWN
jgi:hypothetical protein